MTNWPDHLWLRSFGCATVGWIVLNTRSHYKVAIVVTSSILKVPTKGQTPVPSSRSLWDLVSVSIGFAVQYLLDARDLGILVFHVAQEILLRGFELLLDLVCVYDVLWRQI
jgi:hypothetical protein